MKKEELIDFCSFIGYEHSLLEKWIDSYIDSHAESSYPQTNMTSDRIKEIQEATDYPDSVSVQQALLQVWNECEQEHTKDCYPKECKGCKTPINQSFYCPDCNRRWES